MLDVYRGSATSSLWRLIRGAFEKMFISEVLRYEMIF